MKHTRRQFITNSAMAIGALAILKENACTRTAKGKEIMGVQLYSVRDDMRRDPLGTLTEVSKMGYKYVEHANYVDRKFYGYPAKEFKKVLSDLGMQMKTGHTVLGKDHWDDGTKTFTDKWKYTVEDAAVVGQEIVISPSLGGDYRKSADALKRFMEVFNQSGRLCQQSGMKFGYHNHDFEFLESLDGEKIFDLILKYTDPALVTQQLDIGNMYHAGGIAKDILQQYPGRFESMHVKDEIKAADNKGSGGGYESTVLGKGVIPVKEVIDLGRSIGGTKHFIVEQESYQGLSPLESIRQDYAAMKGWGY